MIHVDRTSFSFYLFFIPVGLRLALCINLSIYMFLSRYFGTVDLFPNDIIDWNSEWSWRWIYIMPNYVEQWRAGITFRYSYFPCRMINPFPLTFINLGRISFIAYLYLFLWAPMCTLLISMLFVGFCYHLWSCVDQPTQDPVNI